MAATGSEAIMIELMKDGWEWIKSERFHKKEADKAKKREANNPMKTCVLKFDHFENIHRFVTSNAKIIKSKPTGHNFLYWIVVAILFYLTGHSIDQCFL